MGENEEEDLYRNFSRKDLQVLCKKYGLPANKSNSEMATSLILYLEKKNIRSRALWQVARRGPYPSDLSELQAGLSMKSVGDQSKDMVSKKGCGNAQFSDSRHTSQKTVEKSKGPASDKASGDIGILTQLHRDRNSGSGIPENALSSVLSSTTEAPLPSFTFDVSSKDGIQLFVDLNSTPSDWIESMKAGVHICSGIDNIKSNNSHQEVGQFCCSSKEKESADGEVNNGSHLTRERTDVAPQADGGEISFSSPRLKSFSYTVHNVEELSEQHAALSSRLGPVIKGQNCVPESVIRFEKGVATVPEKLVATQIKTSNLSGISLLDGNKFKESGYQGLKTGNVLCKESYLKQAIPDSTVKHNRLPEAASMEIQASDCTLVQHHEVGSSCLRVGTYLDSVGQSKNTEMPQLGLFSSKFYQNMYQMQPAQAIDQRQYASPSLFMGNRDNLGRKMEIESGRGSIFSNYNGEIPEHQTQLDDSCKSTIPFLPFQRSPSLKLLEFSSSFGAENVTMMGSHKAGQKAVELHKRDVYLNPCSSGRSFDLAPPKQSVVDHRLFKYSNDFDKDLCHSKKRADELLDVVYLAKNAETENLRITTSHKACQEAVEPRKKDLYLSRGVFDLANPKDNGPNHFILDNSDSLNKGISRTQVRTDVGSSGCSRSGNVRESSGCLDLRNSTEKPWTKAAYSESNGELKRKRNFSNIESKSQSLSPEANILRTSKHLTGNSRTSRRKSSRLVSK